ncbi:MAG: outer membrane protein assembly factor BamD [Candidatus Delongbacteria bacterium]|jgi:antitoxin component YwqK of YwqJK toxin-antitoxin module|nr:outer membrane protein assembly factor BamD [Candidatus Delongbacteria bacterium]
MLKRILILVVIMAMVLSAEIIRKGRKDYFSFFENGESITLDKVNGTVKAYYDSVKVIGEYNYLSGKMDGLQKEFFRDGKVKAEYNMTNGIRTGNGKEYYDSGELEFERNLDQSGTGLGIEYHKNGMKKRERLYKSNEQVYVSKLNHDIKDVKYVRTPEELFVEAQEFAYVGMYAHAIEDYRLFLKLFPKSEKVSNVKFLIAFTYHNNLNDLNNATKEYKEFIKQYPDSPLKVSAEFELNNIGKTIEEIEMFKDL